MNELHLKTYVMRLIPHFSNTGNTLLFEYDLYAGSRLNSSRKDFTQSYLERLEASRLKRPPSHL